MPKPKRYPNQLAKLVVEIATAVRENDAPTDPRAVGSGRKVGSKAVSQSRETLGGCAVGNRAEGR
jgi:hypothetical protein